MAIYENPYGGDDNPYDPDAARRRALLDMMGTTPAQTSGVPDYAPNGAPNLAGGLGLGNSNKQPTASWMAAYGNTPLDGSFARNNPALDSPLPSTLQEIGAKSGPANATRPAPTLPTGTNRATTASGSDTPDVPDPTPSPTAPSSSPPANPYGGGDGRHAGTQILDLYDDPYTRRDTYGGWDPNRKAISSALVSSGNPYAMAAGALGYIDAWAHRHAETAPTDFGVDDARQIIRDAYKDMNGGREISDQELNDALAGQGLRAGSHWVGQAGLQGVLGHLAQNAVASGGGPGSAGTAGSPASSGTPAAAASATAPSGPLASNPNTGVAGGIDTGISGPSGAATGGGGGGVPGNVEGVDAGKWSDPNKHDLKYDALHTIVNAGSIDAAWPQLQQMYPNAQRISGDVIDFGDGTGPVDLQRDSENNGGFHWEPVGGASDSAASAAPAASGPSPLATPGAAQLAAPLANNDVLQQIMAELRRVQAGEPPRAALLSQMGLA